MAVQSCKLTRSVLYYYYLLGASWSIIFLWPQEFSPFLWSLWLFQHPKAFSSSIFLWKSDVSQGLSWALIPLCLHTSWASAAASLSPVRTFQMHTMCSPSLAFSHLFSTVVLEIGCQTWRHNEPAWLHKCHTSEKQKKVKVKSLSHVRLFATPWSVARQAPPSMGFSRQEYWSGLPFPSPGDLPDPGIEPGSPALQADALLSDPPGKTEELGF